MCRDLGIPRFEWIYSESGHGKGPADGVGAAIKRRADETVAKGGSVTNAEDIHQLHSTSKILTFKVASERQFVTVYS